MLQYLSTGTRYFGKVPQPPMPRRGWEIYAVLKGKVAPWFPDQEPEPQLFSDRLWVLPPDSCHGWMGDGEKAARVAVFHFDVLLPQLNITPPNHISVPLTKGDASYIRQLAQENLPRFWQGGPLLTLYSDRLLLDLTLLILEKLAASTSVPKPPVIPPGAHVKVEMAEKWFRANLKDGPSFSHIARFTGTTEGHLRRLFWAVRQRSPKAIMSEIQVDNAKKLLMTTNRKLAVIALECGFLDSSRMCKTFKKETGFTPHQFRKQQR